MAILDSVIEKLTLQDPWEGKTGEQIEDLVSRRLAQPIGKNIKYEGETLSILDPENDEVIAEGKVTVVPPTYYTTITFPQLKVNGVVYTKDVKVNYTDSMVCEAGINVKTFYESSGTKYDLSKPVSIKFYIDGTTDYVLIDNVKPSTHTDDSLQFIDITKLLRKNIQGATLIASVTANNEYSEAIYGATDDNKKGYTTTIHKIELSTSSTHVDNKTVVFNIKGLNTISNMQLQYYAVKLGDNPASASRSYITLDSTSSVELELPTTGAYQIVARVSDAGGTFYSNWVQANVVSYDSQNKESMLAIIGGIPTSIVNCENANLYKIISVPGIGGEVEIVSYLTDEPGIFESVSDWSPYIFNTTSLNTTSNDIPSVSNYYSYIELPSVGQSQKAIAFKLKVKEGNTFVEYPIRHLEVDPSTNKLTSRAFFTVNITENPYNINNAFNYTEGARDNFSQITGQATSLFTGISSNIEASDGWTFDEDLIAYKVSGQNNNLFESAKDLSALITSGQGFSIEVMLKNYNVNGEDPVMNIGNILFGPGYARVNSNDLSDEGIFVNSRADFEKEVITHLMFVYDPAYKPSTYTNVYDQILNENGVKYSDIAHTYPILKIYVNGCINREIQITPELLKDSEGFKLQICPKTSDLNLYIFRTYTRALNYAEIQKNFISSRATSIEKKNIYDRNDILGDDGRISFYKSMLNHNVLVFVLPKDDKPLFFGNKNTTGDGKGPGGEGKSKATILVRYKDEQYKHASGRLTGGKYKAQGSSAKKYLFHNTQYSKGMFLSEEQIANGETEGSSKYTMPTDPEGIKVQKLVGKVNYASSMQSHKQGATKLYDRAYKEIFPEGKLYNTGKKACLEEAFMYFYYNVDDDSKLDTITIEDLYTTSTVNNITVADDAQVKFLGFQTWGSAKADDPTYGYSDATPEYVLFEGADNASPGANFKQPWAAFQTWTSNKTKKENQNTASLMVQQTKETTETDFTTGLLIEGETIQFENDTDPLDVDYGVELLVLDGQTKDDAEKRDLWKFTDAVKHNSLPYFVHFYNNCYQYDFTNIIKNPNEDSSKFDLTKPYGSTNKRIFMSQNTVLYDKETNTGITAQALELFRWDVIKEKWVPAGLHYVDNQWETFNLKDVYEELVNTDLYKKYKGTIIDTTKFGKDITASESSVKQYIIPAFKEMFEATVEEYCDVEDIAYHQAFIRLVSGTDNRAKNTYFQIIGKLYTKNNETGKFEKTDDALGDYKIRLMQDDLDTIFATDNNGQQVKPYYLLEPPFNKDTEDMWGDDHSSFFYPFDVCYYEKINTYVGEIINHLIGSSTSVKDVNSNLYNYFFSIQQQFPEIAYNHHAEIYYEMPQVIFSNGDILKVNGNYVFSNSLSGFSNNNVRNPLSLSHGRCLESEYQFMKDRLLMLGTSTLTATSLYASDRFNVSTVSTGGNTEATVLKGEASYTDYFYPVRSTTDASAYQKIGNITSKEGTTIKFDEVFELILSDPGIPTTIQQLVTPNKTFAVTSAINTVMGTYLNAGSKYKTLKVTQGLDYTHSLLALPNASSLVIDGSTSKYSITDSNIIVRNYLPVVENLVINNTVFANTVLDFRGCNRLETLNLSGCSGIADIIFPENNRLRSVYLPNDLKKLTLGKNPNLSNFVFAEGTFLTDISLDCSSFHSNFDYMDILNNRIDYTGLNQFILKNTPAEGLKITEAVALRLAAIKKNSKVTSLIAGTYLITNRVEKVDENNNTIYTWTSRTNIGYNTKKQLVQAFGNIDSETNNVVFRYTSSTLIRSSYKLPAEISVDAPSGGVFKPFDGLYFTEGNNVGITSTGLLNIKYTIENFPGSVDTATGVVTVTGNTNKYYNFSIRVTLATGEVLEAITGKLYLGYIEPAIGDYAYADGTFSSLYDAEKTLVGLVFQKQVINTGQKWKLGILSNQTITDFAGPDYYSYTSDNKSFNDEDQMNIYSFMTNPLGLGISVLDSPDHLEYVGTSNVFAQVPSTVVNYSTRTDYPTALVSNGKDITNAVATAGLNRLKTILSKDNAVGLLDYMQEKGFVNHQKELTLTWTESDMDEVFEMFNTTVRNGLLFQTSSEYHKTLHPLYIKATLFEPDGLEKSGVNYYSKGSWYIPSVDEIELLVWYRIRSTATATTSKTEAYWNSTEYSKGDSIFSDKSAHFESFLNSKLIAAPISTNNKNLVYGSITYYSSQYTTAYGWFGAYIPNDVWASYSNKDCRRDIQYSITPCCVITVEKPS